MARTVAVTGLSSVALAPSSGALTRHVIGAFPMGLQYQLEAVCDNAMRPLSGPSPVCLCNKTATDPRGTHINPTTHGGSPPEMAIVTFYPSVIHNGMYRITVVLGMPYDYTTLRGDTEKKEESAHLTLLRCCRPRKVPPGTVRLRHHTKITHDECCHQRTAPAGPPHRAACKLYL